MNEMTKPRNDVMHKPVTIGLDDSLSRVVVFPQRQANNPRTESLRGYDLEPYLRVQSRNTAALVGYVRELRRLLQPGAPMDDLPERPAMGPLAPAKPP
jgi:hypothetical protein